MNKTFLKAIIVRAIWTMAEVALGFLTIGLTLSEVQWTTMLSTAVVAGIYSVIKSVTVGLPEVNKDVTFPKEDEIK